MSPTQLSSFKHNARRVYDLYKSLSEYFDIPLVGIVETLLQNVSVDTSSAPDYDHDSEVRKVQHIITLIGAINKYDDYYLTRFAYDEIIFVYNNSVS